MERSAACASALLSGLLCFALLRCAPLRSALHCSGAPRQRVERTEAQEGNVRLPGWQGLQRMCGVRKKHI